LYINDVSCAFYATLRIQKFNCLIFGRQVRSDPEPEAQYEDDRQVLKMTVINIQVPKYAALFNGLNSFQETN
jgi:hypothetical protein